MFASIKRLYVRMILRLSRRAQVRDGTAAEVRYTTGEHITITVTPLIGSTKGISMIIPGSRRRKRQPANSPGIFRPGKPLPTPYSAAVLSDEEVNLPCSTMTTAQLRAKLCSLGADPVSRVPVDEEGAIIEELDFEAMNHEAIHDEEMPEELALELGYTDDGRLTEEQIVERWLQAFIDGNHSFGTAYAWVCAGGWRVSGRRPGYWHSSFCQAAGNPQAERHLAMVPGNNNGNGVLYRTVENPIGTWPRRIWDVCANRVVPFEWVAPGGAGDFWAISHAWTDDMQPNWTDANQRQWPVPLPRGVSLEDVRSELVEMNARYCWLDVLCLRQANPEDPEAEKVRLDEWELDVPTVGIVYVHARRVVTFFNGLGRKFDSEQWNGESPRHWVNRVWTVQETVATQDIIVGGLPVGGINKPFEVHIGNNTKLGNHINSLATILGRTFPADSDIPFELMDPEVQDNQLRAFRMNGAIQLNSATFSKLLTEINRRHTSNPVDKVTALMYLLLNGIHAPRLPVYLPSEDPTAAWDRFIQSTASFSHHPTEYALALLEAFPHRSARHWYPSWTQVTNYPDVSHTETQELAFPLDGRPGSVSPSPSLSPSPPPSAIRLGYGRLVRNCTFTWNRFTGLAQSPHEAGKYTYTLSSPYYESTTVWVSESAFQNGPTQIPDGVYTAFIPRDPAGTELPWMVLCREIGRAEVLDVGAGVGVDGAGGYISADEDRVNGGDQYPGMRVCLRKVATVRWDLKGGGLLMKRMFDLGDGGEEAKHEVWLC